MMNFADLALQQAAKSAESKPRRKLPSGAIPEKPRKRNKPKKMRSAEAEDGQAQASFYIKNEDSSVENEDSSMILQ